MNNSKSILDNCGCCEGVEKQTPANTANDHGLESLLFRVGTHGAFKESMLKGISETAALKELTIRENDDSTIAMIDVWAVILDVLTFYNERIINEGYILTSKERLSLVELAKHISYIPKPGVAAGSWFSFLMNESPGAPTETKIPAGTRVQSIPEQDEAPQIFENIEEILAQTKWNAILPKLTTEQLFVKGVRSLYLEGTSTQLVPGDKILMVGSHRLNDPDSERWDFRTVGEVELNGDENYTLVKWREGLGHDDPSVYPAGDTRVFVFRQRAALFGSNAPDYRTMSEEVKESYNGTNWETDTEWDNFVITSSSSKTIYLDALYPKILTDSWIVLNYPSYTELYRADKAVASAQNNFALATKSTKIRLDTNENLHRFQRRDTVVWAQSEELTLTKAPILLPVFGKNIELEGEFSELEKGQKLIVSGELVAFLKVTSRELVVKKGGTESTEPLPLDFFADDSTAATALQTDDLLQIIGIPQALANDKTKWLVNFEGTDGYVISEVNDLVPFIEERNTAKFEPPSSINQPVIVSELIEISEHDPNQLILKEALKYVYHRPTVNINANITQSTHGETKVETLGSGNASIPFQKFFLKQKPLTYISSESATGIATTLEVRVNDIKWKEVSTFYNTSSEERIFISRIEDDGTCYVQFGNGITGARVPSGVENIVATYRVGIGMEGLLKANQLSMLLNPQLGIKSVTNPLATSGAEDPEPLDKIRDNAPLTVLTLERIVSIADYENFTSAFAGIGKARADLLWKGENRTVHLTVASADKGPIDTTVEENLISAIEGARHNNYPVLVNSFVEKFFNVKARVKINSDYLSDKVIAQIKEELLGAYSFESRTFGQAVTPSELIAVIQSVEGVLAVDLDQLGDEDPFSKAHFRLTAHIGRWELNQIKPAELLLIDENDMDITLMDS